MPKEGEVGIMTLEAAKEMGRRCVLNWLMDVILNPAEAFNTYSYEQQIELAHDAIVLLKEQETMMQCIKGKCRVCPHCSNCDVDEDGLLKEQTPVKPVKSKLSWEHGYNWDIWDCGHCGSQLRSDANYCDRCGHKVNWDDMEENDA